VSDGNESQGAGESQRYTLGESTSALSGR